MSDKPRSSAGKSQPSDDEILALVSRAGPQTVRQLAAAIGCDRSSLNKGLYRLLKEGRLEKEGDVSPLWSVPGGKRRLPSDRVRPVAPVAPSSNEGVSMRPADLDPQQREVVRSGRNSRLVVQAAPGTGKTAVACRRIADLIIEQQCDPSCIHVVSFTRTAVAELRARISADAGDRGARAVRISTLDSRAWQLLYGFSDHEVSALLGDFEENIARVLELLTTDRDELLDHLERLEHLVIDEAQDLVGTRSRLVQEIIKRLSKECGVTVLADSAQAIYGFSMGHDEGEEDDAGESTIEAASRELMFVEALKRSSRLQFHERELSTVWRCSSEALKRLFTVTRREVLIDKAPIEKLRDLKEGILDAADEIHRTIPEELDDRTLVLFRRRFEVLETSGRLHSRLQSHRLRMSGLPAWTCPWIGWLLCTWTERLLPRAFFDQLWAERSGTAPGLFADLTPDGAWTLLRSHGAGDDEGAIDVVALRRVLARSRPPVELCLPDFGAHGPIIGTIHASKGREAERVILQLPRTVGEHPGSDIDEECRVFFVGATRARRSLEVIDANRLPGYRRIRSVDRFNRRLSSSVQCEVGVDGDVVPFSAVREPVVAGADAAMHLQQLLANSVGKVQRLIAFGNEDTSWRYTLCLPERSSQNAVGLLSESVTRDMCRLRARIGGPADAGPKEIKDLYLVGARTVAVAADSEELDRLVKPFSSSGIFLAPVVRGLPTIYR